MGLGEEFLAAVDAKFAHIAAYPASYPFIYRGTRRAHLRRFPYAVLYRVYGETIVVVACLHGRRDPKRWQERT